MKKLFQENRILLLGSFGRRNIGDDVYLKIMLDELNDQIVKFNCWRMDNLPSEIKLASKHSMVPTTMCGSLKIIFSMWRFNCVVYGGGEVWMRLDGSRVPGASLYKMLIVNLLARLLGKKIYYISVGSEPLTGFYRFVAECSAKLATKIYLRDHESAQYLRLKLGTYQILPDLAYLLDDSVVNQVRSHRPRPKQKNLGVSLSSYVRSQSMTATKHLDKMADVVNEHFFDHYVTIIAAMSDEQANESDNKISKKFQQKINCQSDVYGYNSITDCMSLLVNCELVLSYRLHISILCHLLNIPVIGIGYRPKVKKFYQNFSDPRAYCSVENLAVDLNRALRLLPRSFLEQKAITEKTRRQAKLKYAKIFKEIRGNKENGF